ncbi:MAG: potassium channel family protein [Planctomycetota bacterium]|jgi:trk system potassium uptake protein TrkA
MSKFIAVIGMGQTGMELARALARDFQVLAIDSNPDLIDHIVDDVQSARVLDARNFEDLQSVLSSQFDEVVISITENLEASTLATLHCRRLGIRRIRAKALSEDHEAILKAVGATDVIFPEREHAERLAAQIRNPNLLDFIPVAEGFSFLDLVPPQSFVGKSLIELALRRTYNVLVIAVRRGPDFLFLPGPEHRITSGEVLLIVGRDEGLARIQQAEGARTTTTAPLPAAASGHAPPVPPPPAPGLFSHDAGAAAEELRDSLAQSAKTRTLGTPAAGGTGAGKKNKKRAAKPKKKAAKKNPKKKR